MTGEQFVAWAEAAFGKYLPLMKAEVVRWLSAHDEWFLAGMRETALKEHPSIYGKPPGVYELEQMKVRAYERGHTLEAIEASKRGTPLIAAEVEEDYVPAEEAAKILRDTIAKLERKGARE